jgi:hypothetical protein
MKLLLRTFLVTAILASAFAPDAFAYINDQYLVVVDSPQNPAAPQIADRVFVNRNTFSITFSNYTKTASDPCYKTYNTLFYTNETQGKMYCNWGFRFQYNPATFSDGIASNASTFVNRGSISCADPTNYYDVINLNSIYGGAQIIVNAKDVAITNAASIRGGLNNKIQITGKNVDLDRGELTMESSTATYAYDTGIQDGYWGVGASNTLNPRFQFEQTANPYTSYNLVTTRNNTTLYQQLMLTNALGYVSDTVTGSNRYVYAVFLRNTNSAVSTGVFFPGNWIQVEWEWMAGGVTNYLELQDDFGAITNLNYYANTSGTKTTYVPYNYIFYRSQTRYPWPQATPGVPTGTFSPGSVSSDYAAYEALMVPSAVTPYEVPGQTVTNLPGRIEIHADKHLNLDRSRISALSTLLLRATNNYVGRGIRQIVAPYYSVDLGSTNGTLVISNLVAASVPRPCGKIDLWSARWQEASTTGTNFFHVLFVDSQFSPTTQPLVQELRLRSTNSLVLHDDMQVKSNLLVTAVNVTVATNYPGTTPSVAGINILDPTQTWPNAFPNLKAFTNNGPVHVYNVLRFNTSPSKPYTALVNRGTIDAQGIEGNSAYLWNNGKMISFSGDVALTSGSARMNDGTVSSGDQYVYLTSGELYASNLTVSAGAGIVLTITNFLDDGSLTNNVFKRTNGLNTWTVGNGGVQLTRLPQQASLLTTTITNKATINAISPIVWSGRDLGASTAGFSNNAALGRLVLDGAIWSQFAFQPAVAGSALYVDVIDLAGYAATLDDFGNFPGLTVDSGMKVYFADARINGSSVAEKLNGASEGRFVWLGTYAGPFSSSLFVYPDGTTNRINSALAASCFIDTDNDGLVNCIDPHPVNPWLSMMAVDQKFTIRFQKTPAPAAVVSWLAPSNSYNWLFSRPALTNQGDAAFTNWTVLRQFPSGPLDQMVSVTNLLYPTNQFRYYRVRVDKP